MKLKYKIWLDNDGKAFGEGPYQLLMGVKSSGSLARAAKDLHMSYSHAHGLMKNLAERLGFPLIASQAGGVGGGGTHITAQAEDLMRRYDSFMQESADTLEKIFAHHFHAEAGQENSAAKAEPGEQTAEQEMPDQQGAPILTDPPIKLRPLQLAGKDVVSLTGGGGKTSIMYALAEELSASGAKVLLTTTTKIFLPAHGAVNRLIISGEQGIISQLRQGVAPGEIVAVGGGVHGGKLMGLTPEFIDSLAELALVDYVLVEADGAAGKPFKAPAAHEPVIPRSSTVVLNVVGIDALEAPLTDEHFHRAAEIAAICGLSTGVPLEGKNIAAVMLSKAGGRKNVPRGAHWLPVINKIDGEEGVLKAKRIARALVEAGAHDVVFASTLNHKLKVRLWSKNEQ